MKPYQELNIENIKGEVWKDIKGYEGYYQVSSLGRVKSLDRIIPHSRLYQQFIKGKILKPKIVKDFNNHTGDAMISLQVSLTIEGATHYYNIRRLVFAAFKKKIDFKKDGLYVINKDGDGYNNKASNLVLVTKFEKQMRSINKGRQNFEFLKSVDRSGWKRNYLKRMPVTQYSPNGKLIKKHVSIRHAAKFTGIDAKGISNAAKGLYNGCWSGFKWRFSK